MFRSKRVSKRVATELVRRPPTSQQIGEAELSAAIEKAQRTRDSRPLIANQTRFREIAEKNALLSSQLERLIVLNRSGRR